MNRRWRFAAAAIVTFASGWAVAAPRLGARLPSIEGRKLTGTAFSSGTLSGRPSLVVVVTSREAAASARDWFEKARTLGLPAGVQHLALVSIRKPFFIPTRYLESKARAAIPSRYWGDVVVDGGDIAHALQVEPASAPLAVAVNSDGLVTATAVGAPDAPSAKTVFDSLRR